MTDLFATYESDFQLALQEAKSKLTLITSVEGGMYLGRGGLRELTKGYSEDRGTVDGELMIVTDI